MFDKQKTNRELILIKDQTTKLRNDILFLIERSQIEKNLETYNTLNYLYHGIADICNKEIEAIEGRLRGIESVSDRTDTSEGL